jgi:hypothetical protein
MKKVIGGEKTWREEYDAADEAKSAFKKKGGNKKEHVYPSNKCEDVSGVRSVCFRRAWVA